MHSSGPGFSSGLLFLGETVRVPEVDGSSQGSSDLPVLWHLEWEPVRSPHGALNVHGA